MFAPTSQKFKGVIAPTRQRRFFGRLNANFANLLLGKYGVFRPLWQGVMLVHRRVYGGAKDELASIQQTIHQIQNKALIDLHLRFMFTLHFQQPIGMGVTHQERNIVGAPYFLPQRLLLRFNTRAGKEATPLQEQPWRFEQFRHLQPLKAGNDYRTADSLRPLGQIISREQIRKKFLNFFSAATQQYELASHGREQIQSKLLSFSAAAMRQDELVMRSCAFNDRLTWLASHIFSSKINGNIETRDSQHLTRQNFRFALGNERVSVNARPPFLSTLNLLLTSYALKPDSTTPSLSYAQIYASYPITLVHSLSKLQTEKATNILNHFMQAANDAESKPTTGYDRVPLTTAFHAASKLASPYSFPPEMKLAKPPLRDAPAAVKNNAPAPSPTAIAPLPHQTVTQQDLDIQKLTNRVYDEFERKLRKEKERRGL